MNILLVTPRVLYPVLSGAELRMYNLFMAVRQRHTIHWLGHARQEMIAPAIEHLSSRFASVELFATDSRPMQQRSRSTMDRFMEIWRAPIDYFDYFNCDGYWDDVQRAILRRIDESTIDVVYMFGWGMKRYMDPVTKIPVVFDIVDNPVVATARRIRETKRLVEKARVVKEWMMMRRMVTRELAKSRDIIMVSYQDAEALRPLCPQTSVTVVPNGVDSEFYRPGASRNTERPVLIFTGVMSYGPNVSAALYFTRSVYPLIRKEIPDISLLIVGRYPSKEVAALHSAELGITVTGGVDDIREYFDRAMIYVCPIRSGAGIKNKILEAWAMQKPVVATSMACEGIQVSPGEDVMVADDAAEFARQVVHLVRDRELRERLAANGRRKVERQYSWDAGAHMVEEVMSRRVAEYRAGKLAPAADPSSARH
ncbi:MAG: glycosyltransferase family 4 protein [Candidatus Zixiibacteriota bacterium]